ncbi:hypothetical protein SteCoe_20481 [Stentor coeruleus]|uniref:EF-hand domain-containing protein n=1 Tax=Stentor coeruleus TaxID=5963 RepID=A0A1R2BRP0_9CILI|nr:hypothetical protein SteCoe_20481 [Stentor coeruleus]
MISPIKKRDSSLGKFSGVNSYGHKSLLEKLKEKSATMIDGLEAFNSHSKSGLSFDDFQAFLSQSKVSSTSFEIAQLFSKYSKSNTLSINTLKKLLTSRGNSTCKSLTISPYRRGCSLNIERSILEKTCDSMSFTPTACLLDFWKQIKEKLDTPELIIEFFFVKRSDDITIEEFKDSCESLFSNSIDPEIIFLEISEKHNRMTKTEFIKFIENINKTKTQEALSTLRSKLKKKYKNFTQAFEDLKKSSKVLQTDTIFQSLSLKKSNFCANLPETMSKHQFKKLWYGKENLCRIESCNEKSEEYELCSQHFTGIILRGEETLGKIMAMVEPEKCVSVLTSLLLSIKKGTPFVLNNIHKRDVQALQLFLKYKQDKKGMSLTSTPCSSTS